MTAALALQVATLADALAGETDCGDVVAAVPSGSGQWLVVIDGLGHGAPAAQAARRALQQIEQCASAPPGQRLAGDPVALLHRLDAALGASRGAAVGLMWWQDGLARHAGVGNTRALRWRAGEVLRLPSRYGIVGDGQHGAEAADRLPVQALDLRAGDWLLLFTDGLDEALRLPAMLPEWQHDPLGLCRHLMAHWRQSRDDAAVLVAQVVAGDANADVTEAP